MYLYEQLPLLLNILWSVGVNKENVAKFTISFEEIGVAVPEVILIETNHGESRIPGVLVDYLFHRKILLPDDHLHVIGCDGQSP